jgi:hypothetical protein
MFIIGVNDTGDKLFGGANDTADKFISSVNDIGNYSLSGIFNDRPLIPAINLSPLLLTPLNNYRR